MKMNFELTKEQQMIKKSASDFATSVLEPIAYEDDRSGAFPAEAIRKMAEHDFLGMTVPEEFGGLGSDFVSVALMAEAFGKANGAAAAVAVTHVVLVAQTIAMYGTEAQKKKWLPLLEKGEVLGGYGFAEPGAGLGCGADKVTASKNDGGYVLNGKKTFAANGGSAQVYIVIGQTDEEAGAKGFSAFIVDAAEIKTAKPIDKLGLRAFPTAELEFRDAKAELLGKENQGAQIAAEIQARADIAYTAMAAGIGQMMLEASTDHCKNRVQFGAPIGKIQAVQWLLAEIASNVHMMRAAAYRSADCVDRQGDYLMEAAYTKLYAMKAGVEAGMNAVQIHGGIGYSREGKIERYFRDIRGAFLIENTNEFPQKIIAGAILK